MKKKKNICLGLIVVSMLSLLCYFFYEQHKLRSPSYSLGLLQKAVQTHNWQAVNERADLNAIYAEAFDAVIAPTLTQNLAAPLTDALQDVLSKMKTSFVEDMLTYSKDAITTSDPHKAPVPRQIFAKRFVTTTDLFTSSLKAFKNSTIKGDTALVEATLFNQKLEAEFPITLELKRLPDKTWQLISIKNLSTLVAALKDAKAQKLALVNAPLAKQLADVITITPSTFTLVHRQRPWATTAFTYLPTFNFKASKEILRFAGQVDVVDKEGTVLYTQKYIEEGPFASGSSKEVQFRWTLNPFQTQEKILMTKSKEELSIKEKILAVTFADGSTLQLLETL